MKKKLVDLLKILIPLGLGVYLVWYFFSNLTPTDIDQIKTAFGSANYGWIAFSLFFALLSHASRAYRWGFALQHLGYNPRFMNNFFSVMIGYMVNFAIPRLGEVSRCVYQSRYEKIPFNKLLGTVIAERVADLFILLSITFSVIIIQYDVIKDLVNELLGAYANIFTPTNLAILGLAAAIGGGGFLFLLLNNKFQHPILVTIRNIFKGFYDGIASIFKMEKRWWFVFHTLLIWFLYLVMFAFCFLALPETSNMPFAAILTGFVMGGFTIALTNGGLGAYPIAVQSVLVLYGIDKATGGAFGWIVWTAQTLLLVGSGLIAIGLMPMYNKNKTPKSELA